MHAHVCMRTHACSAPEEDLFPVRDILAFCLIRNLFEYFIVPWIYLSRRINMFSFLLSRGFTSWETWGETYIAENLLPTLIGFLELGSV